MINSLRGRLESALPTRIVVDVNGVGYQVFVPLSSFDRLPPVGGDVRILTQMVVREDAHELYGFMTEAERDLFRLLVQHVSGVGPKIALAVLSGMSVTTFKAAVVNADIAALSKISGLGRKTAERIVVELKDKLGVAAAWEAASDEHGPGAEERGFHDAVLALISLGYRQVEAHKALRRVLSERPKGEPAPPAEEMVRLALRLLA